MTDLPPLPMRGYYRRVPGGAYGEHEFTAEALQPAGCPLLFEFSTDLVNWEAIGWWAAMEEDQQVSVGVTTRNEAAYIRATPQSNAEPGTRNAEPPKPGQWNLTARAGLRESVSAKPVLTMTELKARLAALPKPPPLPT
jgi:hypothetical protein